MNLSVSVILPTYNSAPLVVEAVASVLSQTLLPAEVIVVDDGSSDDTRQRLRPYEGRIRYVYQENQGVSVARNHGVHLAGGELVAFLDADDVWHPDKLALQVEVLSRCPNLGLLGTGVFDWPAATLPRIDRPAGDAVLPVPWRQLLVKNYFTTSSVLVRRALLERVGTFDSYLCGSEDYDLWLRIAECAAVANLGLPLTGYRVVAGSLSKHARRMEEGMRHILKKLEQRRAFGGRWLLRRKAHSYCNYACAYMYQASGSPGTALLRLLRSLALYPFPYRRSEVRCPLARPRMFAWLVRRLLPGGQAASAR